MVILMASAGPCNGQMLKGPTAKMKQNYFMKQQKDLVEDLKVSDLSAMKFYLCEMTQI